MTHASSIVDKVVKFVAKETGLTAQAIAMNDDLFKDLGVDGADAEQLMTKFSGEFNVNMNTFYFSNYFGPEAGFNPFWLLLPSWWRWRKERKPITIARLVRAAESGCWQSDNDKEMK